MVFLMQPVHPTLQSIAVKNFIALFKKKPLHNSSIRDSGLDPESRKYLIILDSRFRGNDKIAGFMQFCKGLKK